jgi:hypothetical protein
MNKFLLGLCTAVELACIGGLAAIGLKRNNDAYKAEVKCVELEWELIREKMDWVIKDMEIKTLKKELEQLKKQQQEEESE